MILRQGKRWPSPNIQQSNAPLADTRRARALERSAARHQRGRSGALMHIWAARYCSARCAQRCHAKPHSSWRRGVTAWPRSRAPLYAVSLAQTSLERCEQTCESGNALGTCSAQARFGGSKCRNMNAHGSARAGPASRILLTYEQLNIAVGHENAGFCRARQRIRRSEN